MNKRTRFIGLALILACCLSACMPIAYLDQAQDSFSKGAELENRGRLSWGDFNTPSEGRQVFDKSSLGLTNRNSPEAYYQIAYGQIIKSLQNEGKLRKVNLLPTAYTLKALCEWKLGYDSMALATVREARKEFQSAGKEYFPRDVAVISALPGLIAIDIAYDSLQAMKNRRRTLESAGSSAAAARQAFGVGRNFYETQIRSSKTSPSEKDMAHIQLAIRRLNLTPLGANPDPSLRTYLTVSKLAALKNWAESYNLMENLFCILFDETAANQAWRAELSPWITEQRTWLEQEFATYLEQRNLVLKELAESNGGQEILSSWEVVLISRNALCR